MSSTYLNSLMKAFNKHQNHHHQSNFLCHSLFLKVIFVFFYPKREDRRNIKKSKSSKLTFTSNFSSTLSSSSSYSAKSLDQPFIIPINAAKSNIQLATPTKTMLKEIQYRLDKLSIHGINQNKNQIQTIKIKIN